MLTRQSRTFAGIDWPGDRRRVTIPESAEFYQSGPNRTSRIALPVRWWRCAAVTPFSIQVVSRGEFEKQGFGFAILTIPDEPKSGREIVAFEQTRSR